MQCVHVVTVAVVTVCRSYERYARVDTQDGNQVQAIHRSMADMVSLSEALASVGFKCIGLPWSTDVNPKLETDRADKDRPRIQVVDYVYKHPTLPHTNLQDSVVTLAVVTVCWSYERYARVDTFS